MPLSFEDLVLSRAGDNFVAAALLNDAGLRNVLTASYALAGQVPQGPFTHSVSELGFGGFGFAQSETRIAATGDVHNCYSLETLADDPARIDMLWKGIVRAGGSFPMARIDLESFAAQGVAGLDAEIIGPVPTDPAALETARRAALLARLRAGANDSTAFDDSSIAALLAAASATSVTELLALDGGPARFSQLVLSLTPIAGSTAVRVRDFPVAAAIIVRDFTRSTTSLATMLQASRSILERLRYAGFDPAIGTDLPAAQAAVVWIVDEGWFDEAGWPGVGAGAALRASRIARAGVWLAGQGVALNPVNVS